MSGRHGEVKILTTIGTRNPTPFFVQPVASRYTDCAIPALSYQHILVNGLRYNRLRGRGKESVRANVAFAWISVALQWIFRSKIMSMSGFRHFCLWFIQLRYVSWLQKYVNLKYRICIIKALSLAKIKHNCSSHFVIFSILLLLPIW
jgi:hypothetical protein